MAVREGNPRSSSKHALSDRIRRARQNVEITQGELARRLGIRRAAVTQWESPTGTMPSMQNLLRTAIETGVAFEWLASGRGPMKLELADEVPAFSTACIAQDFEEEALLAAYRAANHRQREALLALAKTLVSGK